MVMEFVVLPWWDKSNAELGQQGGAGTSSVGCTSDGPSTLSMAHEDAALLGAGAGHMSSKSSTSRAQKGKAPGSGVSRRSASVALKL